MEPISVNSSVAGAKIEAHTIEMAELEKGDSSSQGPQNQNYATLPQLNWPSLHLIAGKSDESCHTMYKAALDGDWEKARSWAMIDHHLLLRTAISERYETLLHVAAGARQVNFVKEIIKLIEPKYLTLQDRDGNTAFCIAAAAGSEEIAKQMLYNNPNLIRIRGSKNMTPLYMAVLLGKREMAKFLHAKYGTNYLTTEEKVDLFFQSVKKDFYAMASKLLLDLPKLAVMHDTDGETVLHILARKPASVFVNDRNLIPKSKEITAAGFFLRFCVIKMQQQQPSDFKELMRSPSNVLFEAAKSGNFPFLDLLIRFYPTLAHELDEKKQTIFHIAILHRRDSIFKLIHEIGAFNKELILTYIDVEKNTILHLAAKYPNDQPDPVSSLSSAALEMQHEWILFKEVERLMQPSLKEAKNADGLTPRQLFAKEHKSLLQSGEQWMTKTASSCTVVATLITTVVFSAAFTVPGGSKDETGVPHFLKSHWFRAFAISDAMALSSSSFSILMFLSILTSGYAQADFQRSLPLKLIIGLLSLFMSIIAMMITFCSTYFIVYRDGSNFMPILTLVLVSVPITVFVLLQYPLLRDLFLLTYRSVFPSKSAE